MKRMRIFGLCLVAAFAISVAASATASAVEPEWEGPGAVAGEKIKSKSGASKLETPGLPPIECKSSKSVGKVFGTKEINKLKVTFKTCSAEAGAKVCQSGTKAGLIKTEPIRGTLGYLNKATKKVGVRFTPEKALFAKFVCGSGGGAITVEVKGATFGEDTGNINVQGKTSKTILRNGGSGESKQEFENFEGESPKHLESFFNNAGPFASNQQQEATNTTLNNLGIKA